MHSYQSVLLALVAFAREITRLRNLVAFTSMNLAQPSYLGRYDCIFCMDVLPQFSMTQRVALAQRMQLYLEPGGYCC